jgi:hypothetical protein
MTVITRNPDRPNIKYFKYERPPSHETEDHLVNILQSMAKGLEDQGQAYPMTIFYSDCRVISFGYRYLDSLLGTSNMLGKLSLKIGYLHSTTDNTPKK